LRRGEAAIALPGPRANGQGVAGHCPCPKWHGGPVYDITIAPPPQNWRVCLECHSERHTLLYIVNLIQPAKKFLRIQKILSPNPGSF